ncbi:14934_t:CDS:1, partial [Funneliformis caledonium]
LINVVYWDNIIKSIEVSEMRHERSFMFLNNIDNRSCIVRISLNVIKVFNCIIVIVTVIGSISLRILSIHDH